MNKVFIVYETNSEDGTHVFSVCSTKEIAENMVTAQTNANWFSKFYYESWVVI